MNVFNKGIYFVKALELKPDYLKALIRRAQSYEKLDKLEEALEGNCDIFLILYFVCV